MQKNLNVKNFEQKTIEVLQNDQLRMKCLHTVRALQLPDWYLGAGFLRNAIWDFLHDKPVPTTLNDVDLVYFDPTDPNGEKEEEIEQKLTRLMPETNWEVRNQTRMHLRHNHLPYSDTTDAISRWVEIPTCVGVRLNKNDEFEFTAPFGLDKNWSLKVAPNPVHPPNEEVYKNRIIEKRWKEIWPKLRFEANYWIDG